MSRLLAAAGLVSVLSVPALAAGPLQGLSARPLENRPTCAAPGRLSVCGVDSAKIIPGRVLSARPARERFNAVQRLAGAIADKMEAGAAGNYRIHLQVILK